MPSSILIRKAVITIRWFKHMTDMLEDEWVQDVFMAEYGLAGYGFICGIFEIYAHHCGENAGQKISIPVSTVTRKLRLSRSKVERMLIQCSSMGKLWVNFESKNLILEIPKMAQLKDNYTKDLQATGKKLAYKKKSKEEEYKLTNVNLSEGEGEEDAREKIAQPSQPQFSKIPEKPPEVVWFTIKRPGSHYPGGCYSEKEWLLTETVRYLRAKRHSIDADVSFDTLSVSNSYAYELFTSWIRFPIEKRLAAYVYAVVDRKVPEPADYARRALTAGWEAMERNVVTATKILKNSLEVVFDE